MKMQKLMLEGFEYNYDSFADVLYVSFGAPIESYCEEITDTLLARYSFSSDEITGITIIDATKQSNLSDSLTFLPHEQAQEIVKRVESL